VALGRPSLLTDAVVQKVRHALRSGATREGAAKFARISRRTFYGWLAQGEADGEGPYADFLHMVLLAEGTKEIRAARELSKLVKAGDKQAIFFMLERRCGWSAKSTVTHEDGDAKLSADDATDIEIVRATLAALESRNTPEEP